MALSSLFYGMEAYLDGDVTINNNVGASDTDDAVAAADQSAEIDANLADSSNEAKDSEIQAQMLVQMSKLYTHVKTYGIDRTFLSIYNANGELDKVCGVRFPSCETFSVTGNPRSQYSTRFIAAMEDEGKGFLNWIKNFIAKIWHWIKTRAIAMWQLIRETFGAKLKEFDVAINHFDKELGFADKVKCKGLVGAIAKSGQDRAVNRLGNSIENYQKTLDAAYKALEGYRSLISELRSDVSIKKEQEQANYVADGGETDKKYNASKAGETVNTTKEACSTAQKDLSKLIDEIEKEDSNQVEANGRTIVAEAKNFQKLTNAAAARLDKEHKRFTDLIKDTATITDNFIKEAGFDTNNLTSKAYSIVSLSAKTYLDNEMLMINDIMFTSKKMADFTHDLARALEATIDSNKK